MSLQRSTGKEQKEDGGSHEQGLSQKLRGESFMGDIGIRLKADGKKNKSVRISYYI